MGKFLCVTTLGAIAALVMVPVSVEAQRAPAKNCIVVTVAAGGLENNKVHLRSVEVRGRRAEREGPDRGRGLGPSGFLWELSDWGDNHMALGCIVRCSPGITHAHFRLGFAKCRYSWG